MKIELNLLDNGLDFIIEGLRPIMYSHKTDENTWKYSILNVFSGIELVLKEKLRQEHWSLIFEDVSNASKEKLLEADFISVSHSDLIKRLKGVCNISINDEPINSLRKKRNKFEHFEVNVTIVECKEAIAGALHVLIDFFDIHLSNTCNTEQKEKINGIKAIVMDFETYRDHVLKKHLTTLKNINDNKAGIVVECENCGHDSLVIYKNENKKCQCLVCNHSIWKQDFLKQYREKEEKQFNDEKEGKVRVRSPKERYDIKCPVCDNETKLKSIGEREKSFYYCITCMYKESEEEILSKEEEKRSKEEAIRFENEILELEKNHTPEEFRKIINERILEIQNKLRKLDSEKNL